jgi:hemerythrin
MSFAWTDQLSTGVQEIDTQHKALIEKFNELIAACNQKKGSDEIQEFLHFLTRYVIEHFSDEEHLMQQRRYPGFDVHQREHEGYRERLAKLRDEYIAGMRDEIVSEAVWLAAEWFVGHIKRSDLAMAEYLRKGKKP